MSNGKDSGSYIGQCMYTTAKSTCSACLRGEYSSASSECLYGCDAGEYLKYSFGSKYSVNLVTGSSCESCYGYASLADGCLECVGGGASDCLRCKTGYYLSRDSDELSGSCVAKSVSSTSVSLLVQTAENSAATKDGVTEPFDQLMDAIEYVFSLASETELL